MQKALGLAGLLVAAGTIVSFTGCGGGAGAAGTPATPATVVIQTAATPTLSPAPGTFAAAQSVTLASATPNASIHYTTDGSTPTAASPTFSGPISVSATTTINAMATASGFNPSAVATGTYTITPAGTPPPPPGPSTPPSNGSGNSGVLSYSTFIGGSGADGVTAMTVDAAGNLFLAGTTTSSDFPVSAGAYLTTSNAGSTCGTPPASVVCTGNFVAKLDPTGSKLLYATFFPGDISAIAVDSAGEVYLAGSVDAFVPLPVTAGALNGSGKLFVAKLDSTGSKLLMSARFGSTGIDFLNGMSIDPAGNTYAAGWSYATDYPVTPGAFQTPTTGGFLTKISADGSTMIYSARLGGSDCAAMGSGLFTQPNAVAVDAAGQAFVAGITCSSTFPATPNAFQSTPTSSGGSAFLMKVSADGSTLLYSSLLGGGNTNAFKVAVDGNGLVYIMGNTMGLLTFPLTAGVFQTGYMASDSNFVAKFDPALSGAQSLSFATYLGRGMSPRNSGLAVDAAGNVYIAGSSGAPSFPTTPNAITGCNPSSNSTSAFISVLNGQGTGLLFSTLVGGSGTSAPGGLGLDSLGNVYVAGWTNAPNFPSTAGALRTAAASAEGFALRIDASTVAQMVNAPLPPQWQICSPLSDATLTDPAVSVDSVFQVAGSVSPNQITISIDGTALKTFVNQTATSTVQPIAPGPGTVTVSATTGTQTISKTVTVNATANPFPQPTSISPSTVAAGGPAFTLSVSGTNFVSSSVVQWNGTALVTTFVSSGSLTAAVPASLIAAPGTVTISVFNPPPVGGLAAGPQLIIQ